MRILHTADWHLGKRLGQYERTEEYQLFLSWLIETIKQQAIDAIIISGDIFDVGNPSNAALKQYYDFLWQVKNTHCRNVIIIGGNHDSVATLDAPRDLLSIFNVHVVGGVPNKPEEQIIPIKDASGNTQLVICAVPFLRDKDLRLSVSGETNREQEQRIRQGIVNHYAQLIPYIETYKQQGIPVVATGHLFAAGSSTSQDSEKEIHVGNLGQVSGAMFPPEFEYIALGHLHRPQMVNKMPHIRYSGSPLALSFSENEDRKVVLIADLSKEQPLSVQEIPVPVFRRLIRIKGSLDKVKSTLYTLETFPEQLPAWIEIQTETDIPIHDLDEQLNALIINKPELEIIFSRQFRTNKPQNATKQPEESIPLTSHSPVSIFELKCKSEYKDHPYDDLMQTFREALELMNESK